MRSRRTAEQLRAEEIVKVASEIGKIIVAQDACTAAMAAPRAAADDEYKTQVYTVCYLSILRLVLLLYITGLTM